VFVRITSAKSNLAAQVWCKRFKTNSNCSFGFNDFVMGYLRDAREEDDRIILMVEITNPLAKEYLLELGKKDKNSNT
jgi:hypothetical protein